MRSALISLAATATLVLSASSNLLKLLTEGVPDLPDPPPSVPEPPTVGPQAARTTPRQAEQQP